MAAPLRAPLMTLLVLVFVWAGLSHAEDKPVTKIEDKAAAERDAKELLDVMALIEQQFEAAGGAHDSADAVRLTLAWTKRHSAVSEATLSPDSNSIQFELKSGLSGVVTLISNPAKDSLEPVPPKKDSL